MPVAPWIPAFLALLLSACAAAGPPPRLYVLSSLSSPGAGPLQLAAASEGRAGSGSASATRRATKTTIGVAPVTVARYLDRPEIIVRRTANELQLLDGDRWAEPIGANATRALVENLDVLLPRSRISTMPLPGSQRPAYELSFDITAFEIDETGTAVLAGDWVLIDHATQAVRAGGPLHKSIAVGRDAGGDAIAAAMSRNLAAASEDIAREIAGITQPRKSRGRADR